MKVSKSMEEIWAIKERIGRELEGKSQDEVLAYFQKQEQIWRDRLRASNERKSHDAACGPLSGEGV